MSAHKPVSSLVDKRVAYELLLACLPRAEQWWGAISARRDGSSAGVVFQIVNCIRGEVHVRLGDLAEQQDVALMWSMDVCSWPVVDVTATYTILIALIPGRKLWQLAVGLRRDGSTPDGVFAGLDELRQMFHIALGEVRELSCCGKAVLGRG